MVDIESYVYDKCARAVLAVEPDAFTTSTYVSAPASFPAVQVSEIGNITDTKTLDSSLAEKTSVVTFECNTYSNLRSGAKRQAKRIAQEVDAVMASMGFARTFMGFVANPADTSVYRITSRYTAVAGTDGQIYRR